MTTVRPVSCDAVRDLAPLFVSGALEPAEEAAVRSHLLTCADLHGEVGAFGGSAQALLESVEPIEPSAGLRDRLLAAAAADLVEGRHPATALPPVIAPAAAVAGDARMPRPEPAVAAPVALASRRRTPVLWMALAAALILVLGGLGLQLRLDLDAAQAYRDGVAAALSLAAQPGSQVALLAADDGSVSGLGVVGSDGTTRIVVRGLPSTTGTEVYTAWSITGSTAPVPIGEFTVGADGTAVASARSPAPAPGVVLALTLEPHPGATTPTLPVIAKGVARPTKG